VSARVSAVPSTQPLPERRRIGDRFGDLFLHGLTGAAAVAAAVLLGAIAWKIFQLAWPAITKYGFAFVTRQGWDTHTTNDDQNGYHELTFASLIRLMDQLTTLPGLVVRETIVPVATATGTISSEYCNARLSFAASVRP